MTSDLCYACHGDDSILWHSTATHTLHQLPYCALGESRPAKDFVLVLLSVGEGRHQQLHLPSHLLLLILHRALDCLQLRGISYVHGMKQKSTSYMYVYTAVTYGSRVN